jgi:hypothetical protein
MFKKLRQVYEDWRLSKYYLSIKDVPMYNWITLYENEDFTQLSKTGKICKRVTKVYEKLQDEIIDNFGINEDFLKVLKNKIRIELLYADQIESGNKSNQWKIEMLEIDNEMLSNQKTKADLYDSIIAIEKYLGVSKDPKQLTVYQFYKYSQTINNRLKHEQANGRK